MSELILIRHGQASFGEDNYDELSDLGRFQATHLGRYWRGAGWEFDRIFAGPRDRQVETARVVGDVMRDEGRAWPETAVLRGFDEHHIDQLLMNEAGSELRKQADIARLLEELQQAQNATDRQKKYHRVFEAVTHRWIQGDTLGIESWSQFQTRVAAALQEVISQVGRGKRVAVFTSVGPITVILQRALACSDRVSLQTGWRLNNCSLTSFLFSGDRLTLDGFNATPHLQSEELTYR